MIRARRVTHRYIFATLAFLIPTFLVIGLVFRPDVPPLFTPDPVVLSKTGFVTSAHSDLRRIQAGEYTFDVAVEADGTTQPALIIRPVSILLKPDVLVYWVADAPAKELLPDGALLLGELSGTSLRRMEIPPGAADGHGTVMIFSFGHQEVIAQFSLGLNDSVEG